jgi:hypothetical protein
MRAMNRWEQPSRGATTLQDQINRMFSEGVGPIYQNGVLTLSLPKREEAKPKQIKVNVGTHAVGTHVMAAGTR